VGAATDLPLRDGEIIWIDRHLGFNWLQIMTALDHSPRLLGILNGAYATFTTQLVGAALVLVIAKRTRDLDRFFITFACASIIAEAMSVLVPTLGPIWALAGNARFANLPTLGRNHRRDRPCIAGQKSRHDRFRSRQRNYKFPVCPRGRSDNRALYAALEPLAVLADRVFGRGDAHFRGPERQSLCGRYIRRCHNRRQAITCGKMIQQSLEHLFGDEFEYAPQRMIRVSHKGGA